MTAKKNIAIVGGAPSWEGAPFNDPDWEIWAVSVMYSRLPKDHVHRWFEVHDTKEVTGRDPALYPDFQDWMFKDTSRATVTVMGGRGLDDTLNSISLPIEALTERFGDKWWSSSIAYMFAQALEEGDGAIGLYGVEMCADDEYEYQQAALRHFQDIALLTGRDVIIPKGCNLFHPMPIYPNLNSHSSSHCTREVKRLTQEKAILQSQIKELEAKANHVEGALAVYDHLIRNNWV